VLKALKSNKASSPDGFSLAFFQSCLEVLKEDVMNVFPEFHAWNKFERSLSDIFIALIPKKEGAVDLNIFSLSNLWAVSIKLSLKP
jgi:hypothetical protein